jgi:prepilin-type N-terminal cleavage/methylation domain-containing protein
MNVQRKEKGFTIIEVVLVLAIAGLIFLMVFIALPALQRSQRDSARKQEVGTVASSITSYQGNNRGNNPTDVQIGQYITGNASAVLASGSTVIIRANAYTAPITLSANIQASPNTSDNILYADQMKVYYGYQCDPTSSTGLIRGTTRQSAIAVALESGPAAGSVYCQTD